MKFEWNLRKAQQNLLDHEISFEEATTVFGDLLAGTIPDPITAREKCVSLRSA